MRTILNENHRKKKNKQLNEIKTIQDIKIGFIKEIESLKKGQNKVNLEVKNAES